MSPDNMPINSDRDCEPATCEEELKFEIALRQQLKADLYTAEYRLKMLLYKTGVFESELDQFIKEAES